MHYKPRHFDLSGLKGISDATLEQHFNLYAGYVTHTNQLLEQLAEFSGNAGADEKRMAVFSGLKRRLAFEYNGMVLHELYFANLRRQGESGPARDSAFRAAVEQSCGSYRHWEADFMSVGTIRGVGWAICCQDPITGSLSNHWVEMHQSGHISGFVPVLVMDVWEHAFMLDYAVKDRPKYIEAFLSNVDWRAVDRRLSRQREAVAA